MSKPSSISDLLTDTLRELKIGDLLSVLAPQEFSKDEEPYDFSKKEKSTPSAQPPAAEVPLRFLLNRVKDESGVSGTGIVAYGAWFADGTAVIRWNTQTASTGIYPSIEALFKIHGHEGSTKLEWID